MVPYRVSKANNPIHKWTADDRIIICLLRYPYDVPRRKRSALFSEITRRRLALEGFLGDIPLTSLDAQISEMKEYGKGHDVWSAIQGLTRLLAEQYYPMQTAKIHAAAQQLNISFPVQKSTSQRIRRRDRSAPKRRRWSSVVTTTTIEELSDADRPQRPANAQLSRFFFDSTDLGSSYQPKSTNETATAVVTRYASATPVPTTIQSNVDIHGNPCRKHPVLLFRACEDEFLFRSRKYRDSSTNIPSPPVFGTEEFTNLVWPHLMRSHSYESPFISLTQSAHNALRRIELAKAEDENKERHLGIFTYNAIHEDAMVRFPGADIPYLVASLFSKDKYSELPDGYKGTGEWLAFGSIDCHPLTTLHCTDAIKLARALRRTHVSLQDTAMEISSCLRNVPNKWKKMVTYTILHSHRRLSKNLSPKSPRFNALVNMISATRDTDLNPGQLQSDLVHNVGLDREQWDIITREAARPLTTPEISPRCNDWSRPSNSKRVVNQIVTYLNNIAGRKQTPENSQAQSSQSSVNSIREQEGQIATDQPTPPQQNIDQGKNQDKHSQISRGQVVERTLYDEWDYVEDSLENGFLTQFPDAARKLRKIKSRITRNIE